MVCESEDYQPYKLERGAQNLIESLRGEGIDLVFDETREREIYETETRFLVVRRKQTADPSSKPLVRIKQDQHSNGADVEVYKRNDISKVDTLIRNNVWRIIRDLFKRIN